MSGVTLDARIRQDDLTELLKECGLVELNYFWKMKCSGPSWKPVTYERSYLEIKVGSYTARCGTSGLFKKDDKNRRGIAKNPEQARDFLEKGAEKIRKYLKYIGNPECRIICYYLKGYPGHDKPLFVLPENK